MVRIQVWYYSIIWYNGIWNGTHSYFTFFNCIKWYSMFGLVSEFDVIQCDTMTYGMELTNL